MNCTNLLDAGSSLRSNTTLGDELEAGYTSSLVACSAPLLNESCESDAEHELLSEMVNSPGLARECDIARRSCSSCVCTSPFAINTTVTVLDFRRP